MLRYFDRYQKHDENNMVLYEKYSRKDVCRLMNWDKDESSTIYGYRIKHNTCPIFVTYEKQEDISDSTKYEDAFGKLCLTGEELVDEIIKTVNNNFEAEPIYKERMEKFFFNVKYRKDRLYDILKEN